MSVEEIHIDPTTAMDPNTTNAKPTVPPLSLHAMMETLMMTQEAHGQLLDNLLTEVASLRDDFSEYRSSFPPLTPPDS